MVFEPETKKGPMVVPSDLDLVLSHNKLSVYPLSNWLLDECFVGKAEDLVVHVAHDHQATRDAAETRSRKSLHCKQIKSRTACILTD